MTEPLNAGLIWSSKFFEYFRIRAPEPLSSWADKHRIIADGASPEPGKWRTDRTPYFRAIMDAVTRPEVRQVVVCSGIQLGKTELLLNALCYYVQHEPSPIMLVEPSAGLAGDIGYDRIDTMIRTSPELRPLFGLDEDKARSTKTGQIKIDAKRFQGGYIKLASAASPSDLASRPIRVVLCDEVDKYPTASGENPVDRAIGRTSNFVDRKVLIVSSPGALQSSEVWRRLGMCTRYEFRVPCPHCGEFVPWSWQCVKWDKDAEGVSDPSTARIECPTCGGIMRGSGMPSPAILQAGEWFYISGPETGDKVGYQISGLYSPWQTLDGIVSEWLQAVHSRDVDRLRVFIQDRLAEPWDDREPMWREKEEPDSLPRFEESPDYSTVRYLTAGVDVQRDRVEVSIWGWGANSESWVVAHEILPGDVLSGALWTRVRRLLTSPVLLPDGREGRIKGACVDSGDGYSTQTVYKFCTPLEKNHIVAIKGVAGENAPIISCPTRSAATRSPLYKLGVDRLKRIIYDRLSIQTPGPGYMHIPESMSGEFWAQLTSEAPETVIEHGKTVTRWKKLRQRNEALDCAAYALAAYELFCHPAPRKRKN